jgi:signal transduction histidine kinase
MEKLESGEIEAKMNKKENYISFLDKLMLFISHKFRQPVANILGLSNLINSKAISKKELNECLLFIRQCALSLDKQTREMSRLVHEKITKQKKPTTKQKPNRLEHLFKH